jgi:hypothetical protein
VRTRRSAIRAGMDRLSEKDRATLLLEAWKKTIDAQTQFNTIEMLVRNLSLAILGAVVALGNIIGRFPGGPDWPTEAFTFLALVLLIGPLWTLDRLWYHRLIFFSVQEAVQLEAELNLLGIRVQLNTTIDRKNAIPLCKKELRSRHKIDLFYLVLGTIGLLAAGYCGAHIWSGWFWLSLEAVALAWIFCVSAWWRHNSPHEASKPDAGAVSPPAV